MKHCLFFFVSILLLSCSERPISKKSRTKVILDTDMGSDCDDVGALALLNEYENQEKVEILGVIYSSGVIPFGPGIIDAINKYYGNDQIPVGANYGSLVGDPVDKMQAEKLSKDTAAFKNKIIMNADAIEQTKLNRNILVSQPDNSIIYITIGHTKGLYDLLVSKPDSISLLSGVELTKKKVKKWIALGALNASNKEKYHVKDWNFFFNGTAEYTKFVVENFPKPIYFIDAGSDIMTGKSLIDTPCGNIVRTAYRDWLWNVEQKTLKDQRPSWDLMTVYFAVENPRKYFEIMENGYLEFDIEKGCRWNKTDSITNQYFMLQKDSHQEEISNYLNEMISKPKSGLATKKE